MMGERSRSATDGRERKAGATPLAATLFEVAKMLAAAGGLGLAALVARLFVVLMLASFLEDARLLKLLLEAP